MLARKLLVNQIKDESKIEKIISFLCSESGNHDYTINRREAKNELGLNIEKPSDSLYGLISRTYISIRDELQLRTSFNPESYLGPDTSKEYTIKRTLIESLAGGTDCFVSEGRFSKIGLTANSVPQMGIQDQRIFEGWKHYDYSYQTSNGISYLAKQTTDMAPVNVNTTVVPTAISNINKSNVIFVKSVAETIYIQPMVINSVLCLN